MAELQSKNKIAKNIFVALAAQIVSVVASFVLGLIVPKFIDEYQYAYWQTFLLYFGYIGLVPLGLLDGIILRFSDRDYGELDKKKIAGQFRILMLWATVLSAVLIAVSFFLETQETRWILRLLALAILVHLFYAYNLDIYQITNRINYYATFVVVQRVLYVLIIVVLLLLKVNHFALICLAEIVGELVAAVIGTAKNRGLYLSRGDRIGEELKEVRANVSAGFLLMVANFSANFIVGGAKMVIQWRWDMLVFGKVSFSFSVANLFLTFVTAIGVVLFPSLKRMKQEELPDLYGKVRNVLSPVLVYALIFYFPVCVILELWLPNYAESLVYLGILLPVIVYLSKVNLLTNNYLKAYREEKKMFFINIGSIAIGFLLFLLCAYGLDNLDLLLYSVVLIIVVRSVVSEIVVSKIIGKKFGKDYAAELAMTIVFVVVVRYLNLWQGCLAYLAAIAGYTVIYRKEIRNLLKSLKNAIKNKFSKKKEES